MVGHSVGRQKIVVLTQVCSLYEQYTDVNKAKYI